MVPRLGLYAADYSATPYDYEELLAALAPRPLLLYCPLRDRFANATDVARAIEAARPAWRAVPEALEAQRPDAPSDFREAEVAAALDWIERVVLKANVTL